jgi:hypothetical protein
MDSPNENLLSRLEQSLRQSRAARMHLAHACEVETEADTVQAELAEMDTLASQTGGNLSAAVIRPGVGQSLAGLAQMLNSKRQCANHFNLIKISRHCDPAHCSRASPAKFRQSEQRGST